MSSLYKNLFILGTYTLNSESEPVKKLLALELELIRKEIEEEVEIEV
ncbi:MAG: hypothetical protein KAV48_02460 [Methanomicrobia archaeon]|nr:hypothetical protein [Methanomicrobia archaeon]